MAAFYPVDYKRSLEKQRLTYKWSIGLVVTYCMSAFNALVILALVTMPLFVKFPFMANSWMPFYISFVALIYVWTLINLYLFNSLIRLEGIDYRDNSDDIIEALSKYFKLENLDLGSTNVVRDIRLPWAFKAGRIITVLIDEEVIYLNAVRLVRPGNMNLYSATFMYFKCKRVAKEFHKVQAANPQHN